MLLARMAEAVYWAGRYLERAEDTARIVQVHGETHIDLPVGEDVGWEPLAEIAGTAAAYKELSAKPPSPPAQRSKRTVETGIIAFVLTERDNPSSVLASIAGARANLRNARPVVPREVWELCNELWLSVGGEALNVARRDQRVGWLQLVIDEIQRINGVLQGTMRRDEAFVFFRMGQHLERAEITCRVLDVRAQSALPAPGHELYAEVHQMSLLRSLASYQPSRRAMPARRDAASTLKFLLQDESFPRAVGACISELRDLIKSLPNNEPVLSACTDTAVLIADAPVKQPTAGGLRSFMSELQPAIDHLHHQIEASFFAAATQQTPVAAASSPMRGLTAAKFETDGSLAARTAATKMGDMTDGRSYRVTHTTSYAYARPVEQAHNETHLRPRNTEHQICVSHQLDIEPAPSTWFDSLDAFGNVVSTFVVRGGFDRMEVTATSEVVVSPPPSPPPGPPWESVRAMLDVDRQHAARDARRFRAPSRLVPTLNALAEYAEASFRPGRPLVEAVMDLNDRIHREFVYEPGFTSISTPLREVFERKRGVCQDFAHLMVGCIRSLGLSARYVSGYIETFPPPGQERLIGADASHAWASVYLPGWGWVDTDPTNDQLVSDAHITTAWGRDYWDVSPLRGSVEGGGDSHQLDVAVDVSRIEAHAEV